MRYYAIAATALCAMLAFHTTDAAAKHARTSRATAGHASAKGPDELFASGFDLLSDGKYEQAAESFAAGLSLDSSNANALFYYGEALTNLGKTNEAANAYRHAIAEGLSGDNAATVRMRLGATKGNGAPAVSSAAAAPPPPAAPPAINPASITLPTGLTLADWEGWAVDQLKAQKLEDVLTQGYAYRSQYGNVAHLDEILNVAVQYKLAKVQIDSPASAARNRDMLIDLAQKFPGSRASVLLDTANVYVKVGDGDWKSDHQDYDGAAATYQGALEMVGPGDPLRKLVVNRIMLAQAHQSYRRTLQTMGQTIDADVQKTIENSDAFQHWPTATQHNISFTDYRTTTSTDGTSTAYQTQSDIKVDGPELTLDAKTHYTGLGHMSDVNSGHLCVFGGLLCLPTAGASSITGVSVSGDMNPEQVGTTLSLRYTFHYKDAAGKETITDPQSYDYSVVRELKASELDPSLTGDAYEIDGVSNSGNYRLNLKNYYLSNLGVMLSAIGTSQFTSDRDFRYVLPHTGDTITDNINNGPVINRHTLVQLTIR